LKSLCDTLPGFGPTRPLLTAGGTALDCREPTSPGVLTAGTFYQHGKRIFWDVHNPENTIVIELRDERYDELIVEVADPQLTVELVRAALPASNQAKS
jgi:hypothetical protein